MLVGNLLANQLNIDGSNLFIGICLEGLGMMRL